jgi:hypothetical protein
MPTEVRSREGSHRTAPPRHAHRFPARPSRRRTPERRRGPRGAPSQPARPPLPRAASARVVRDAEVLILLTTPIRRPRPSTQAPSTRHRRDADAPRGQNQRGATTSAATLSERLFFTGNSPPAQRCAQRWTRTSRRPNQQFGRRRDFSNPMQISLPAESGKSLRLSLPVMPVMPRGKCAHNAHARSHMGTTRSGTYTAGRLAWSTRLG